RSPGPRPPPQGRQPPRRPHRPRKAAAVSEQKVCKPSPTNQHAEAHRRARPGAAMSAAEEVKAKSEAGGEHLLHCGLAAARAIDDPEACAAHVGAWALRLVRVDPGGAAALLPEALDDPGLQVEVLTTAAGVLLSRGEAGGEELWRDAASRLKEVEDPEQQLRLMNGLCELGIEQATHNPEGARSLLRRLVSCAPCAARPGDPPAPGRALALALVGEALAALGDAEGVELLHRA